MSQVLLSAFLTATVTTALLLYLSLRHYSRTGPRLRAEIKRHFRGFAARSLLRLSGWAFAILFLIAAISGTIYLILARAWQWPVSPPVLIAVACLGIGLVTGSLFVHYLVHSPGLLMASLQFRFSRLDPLWRWLVRHRRLVRRGAQAAAAIMGAALLHALLVTGETALLVAIFALAALAVAGRHLRRSTGTPSRPKRPRRPNVILIGADTLRADRLGDADYVRNLTPNIDRLAERGILLRNCYTPLARTAPSLTSLLTGCWPHHHGIRTNFPSESQLEPPVPSLIHCLNRAGYATAAVSDWAGADLGKIHFGFQQGDLPPDQWNLKYLIRQGPPLLRLFLSLFCHNRFGKRFLPEIHYLAGVPLTRECFTRAKALIDELATEERPFFLQLFTATTHVPFASDYPYYDLFTPADYQGESRFVMTKLASPEEIVRKQEFGPEAFDIPQIRNLYDGCVVQFDDEVDRLLKHLEARGLADDTIVVVYSDHGADFFETGCWGQGNTLLGDDPSYRVPVVVFDPTGRLPAGVRLDTSTRTVDIAPTLLDLLGLEIPDTMDGVSLVPFLTGETPPQDLPAFMETGLWLGKVPGLDDDHLRYPNLVELLDIPDKDSGMLTVAAHWYPQVIRAKDRAVRLGNWKLVRVALISGPRYHLYDMERDPGCTRDVATEHPVVFRYLKSLLNAWISEDPCMSPDISAERNRPCVISSS